MRKSRTELDGCIGLFCCDTIIVPRKPWTVSAGWYRVFWFVTSCPAVSCFLQKEEYLCAVYKDFRVLLAILATNTNKLDNHNLFFYPFSPQTSKQSSIIGPHMKYKFSAMEMKTKAICTFAIPRGIILGLFTMKYSLYLILF